MKPELSGREKVRILHDIERRYDLFSYREDGWSVWRVVRSVAHDRALGLPLSKPALSNALRSWHALKATLVFVCILLTAGQRDLLVKTYRSALRMRQGTQFRDIYFDGLLQYGYSYLKLEVVDSFAFGKQASRMLRPANLDASVFTFWGRILAILLPRSGARSFTDHVEQLLGQEVGTKISSRYLLRLVSSVYWQSRLYGLLLARIKPRVVMVKNPGDYGLRLACHRQGIKFIELQHGVFDSAHPNAVPAWVAGTKPALLLPDVMGCFGQYWIEQLENTRQADCDMVAIGNEAIDHARQCRRARSASPPIKLVLTSQGLDTTRLVGWIEAMLASAPALAWRLWIKLHPTYDTDPGAYDGLGRRSGVTIVPGGEAPNVFELLVGCDLHLSIASFCHFDAAALGVPSVVIPLLGHEGMLDSVDGTSITLAKSPEDVWKSIQRPPVGDSAMHRYIAPNFVSNLRNLIACDLSPN